MYSMGAKCEWLLPRVCVGGCVPVCACLCGHVRLLGTHVHNCVYIRACPCLRTCVHVCGHMCSYQDFFLLAVDCSVVDDKHLSWPAFRKTTMELITPQPSAFTGNFFCISVSSECKRLGIVTVLYFTEVLKSFFKKFLTNLNRLWKKCLNAKLLW